MILMNYTDYATNETRKKENTYGGVGYYRIVKPGQYLKAKVIGKEVKDYGITLEDQWDNIFKDHDAYWASYFTDDKVASAIIYHAQKHKKKLVVDLDDSYLDVPESNKLYDRFKEGKRDRAMLSTILSFADTVVCSTEPLAQRTREHIKAIHGIEKNIVVLPNMHDMSDWQFPVEKTERFTIGYVGSNSHYEDLMMVMPAIRTIMEKNPHVYFHTIGAIEKNLIPKYFQGFTDEMLNRCSLGAATQTFKEFPEHLAKQGFDIGIAPLIDTPFTRSKSHIKWMEYASYKIPTVASRVYPYFMSLEGRKTIEDGKTGFLCRTQEEWIDRLQKLIDSKDLREKIGQQAYDAVNKNWQYKDYDFDLVAKKILA